MTATEKLAHKRLTLNLPRFSGHLGKPNVYGQQEVIHCQRKSERPTIENSSWRPLG